MLWDARNGSYIRFIALHFEYICIFSLQLFLLCSFSFIPHFFFFFFLSIRRFFLLSEWEEEREAWIQMRVLLHFFSSICVIHHRVHSSSFIPFLSFFFLVLSSFFDSLSYVFSLPSHSNPLLSEGERVRKGNFGRKRDEGWFDPVSMDTRFERVERKKDESLEERKDETRLCFLGKEFF